MGLIWANKFNSFHYFCENIKTNSVRIKQILVAFLFTALVISCEKTAKDIDVKEIKTECEFVDASMIVIDEMIALAESIDSEEGPSKEQKKEEEYLKEKYDEIEEHAEKSDFEGNLKDCPSFESIVKKNKKLVKPMKSFQKAKDINASELTTECEVADASMIVIDEMIALAEAVDSEEGASEEQKEEIKSLGEKLQEIGEKSDELGFKEADLEDCPNFETLKKKIKKTRKLRNF